MSRTMEQKLGLERWVHMSIHCTASWSLAPACACLLLPSVLVDRLSSPHHYHSPHSFTKLFHYSFTKHSLHSSTAKLRFYLTSTSAMADRPPVLWALSPRRRPLQEGKSPSTYLKATRELPPISWALSSSPGALHDNGSLSTSQDAFTINVSRHLEGNESQDDGYIKLEYSYPVSECEEDDSGTSGGGMSTSCEDSDITAVQHAASASVAANLPAAFGSGNRSFSLETEATRNNRVELVTRKLGNIQKREARISECNRELDRITAEVTALSKDTTSKQNCLSISRDVLTKIDFGSGNDTERFVHHLVTLGEEKHAVSAILQKTAKKYRRSQGRIEKRRQKQSDKRGQHEARNSSNKVRVKVGGWTEDPMVVSNAYRNATPAATKVKGEEVGKKEEGFESGTAARGESLKVEEK